MLSSTRRMWIKNTTLVMSGDAERGREERREERRERRKEKKGRDSKEERKGEG